MKIHSCFKETILKLLAFLSDINGLIKFMNMELNIKCYEYIVIVWILKVNIEILQKYCNFQFDSNNIDIELTSRACFQVSEIWIRKMKELIINVKF